MLNESSFKHSHSSHPILIQVNDASVRVHIPWEVWSGKWEIHVKFINVLSFYQLTAITQWQIKMLFTKSSFVTGSPPLAFLLQPFFIWDNETKLFLVFKRNISFITRDFSEFSCNIIPLLRDFNQNLTASDFFAVYFGNFQ